MTNVMKRKIPHLMALAVALSISAMTADTHATATTIGTDPMKYYGERIAFDVIRKGDTVGEHIVTFRRDGSDIVANSAFNLTIRVLSIPFYRYSYVSEGRWRNGRLISLNAKTDDNGDVSTVTVEPYGNLLKVNAAVTDTATLFPTTHWNSGVIGSTAVINTITGEINRVTMKDLGIETVVTGDRTRDARRYAYTGDLTTEVWYDQYDRWVKMQFAGSDGTMIKYRCRTCGIDDVEQGTKTDDGSSPLREQASIGHE